MLKNHAKQQLFVRDVCLNVCILPHFKVLNRRCQYPLAVTFSFQGFDIWSIEKDFFKEIEIVEKCGAD